MATGNEFLDGFVQFAQKDPQLTIMISVVGAIVVFFFINMIGGDKK